MISFEPFKATDAFTMQNFNEKLGGAISQVNSEFQSVKDSSVKIETGSYVGTGEYGKNNPNTLTFGFKPKFVTFIDNGYYNGSKILYESLFQRARNLINCELLPDSYGDSAYFLGPSGYVGQQYTNWKEAAWKTNGGKTINWLSTNSAAYQFNEINHAYYYIAIG